MIAVRNLEKSYAGFRALKGISFEVGAGEIAGFVGPNGAGKTTTLRILAGFLSATGGDVSVAGYRVDRQSRAVRRRCGYLPEDVPLYRDLTVESLLGYLAGLKEVPSGRVPQEVDRVIGLTGLAPVRQRLVGKCSKGFRQRTGLAQALLGDPPVLLLDEPTSGLDPNQVVEVRELIRQLSGEKTVLLSSHVLSEVAQICGRVLIVHEGSLVAGGTPAELARQYGTGERLRARLAAPLDAAALQGLSDLGGISWEEATLTLRVGVENARASAPAVARALVAAGAELLELAPEAADLEAVFRTVTRSDRDA